MTSPGRDKTRLCPVIPALTQDVWMISVAQNTLSDQEAGDVMLALGKPSVTRKRLVRAALSQ